MHNVVMIIEESGTTLTVDSVVVAQGDIHMTVDNSRDIARFDAMRAVPQIVSVSLWYDKDKGPRVELHTTGQDFDTVKEKLIQLRDRLTQEIDNGPSMCPFAPKEQEATHVARNKQEAD